MQNSQNSDEKIVIRPQDLTAPAADHVVITEGELSEATSAAPSRRASSTRWWLAAGTLVPFWNAWIWWHLPVDARTGRRLAKAFAVVLAMASLGVLVYLTVILLRQRVDWIERVAESADRSVVRIQNGDSAGTGFVVAEKDGQCLILTNGHVIDDLKDCAVSGRFTPWLPARVAGLPRDPNVDLALLVVSSDSLETLGPIASFDSVRPGQQVVAVGHPLGLDYTITHGIISGKRSGMLLQTTAPINHGNSGGPLINRQGKVVGVNTSTIDPNEGYGIGFATRADLVHERNVWDFSIDVSDLLRQIDP